MFHIVISYRVIFHIKFIAKELFFALDINSTSIPYQ